MFRLLKSIRDVSISMSFLAIASATVHAQPAKLSLPDLLEAKYAYWTPTASVNHVQYFMGHLKGPDPRAPTPRALLKFDAAQAEITTVMTAEALSEAFGERPSIWGLTLGSTGRQLAMLVSRTRDDGGIELDIALLDPDAGKVQRILADGRFNHAPSFSPDGRYLAYYSNAADIRDDPKRVIQYGAGKLLELATGQVTLSVNEFRDTKHWHFGSPPLWLDFERVVFATMCDDGTMIRAQVKDYEGGLCPRAAVVNAQRREVRELMLPYGKVPPRILHDPQHRRIVLCGLPRIAISTDYNFQDKQVIVEAGANQRLFVQGLRADGTLQYELKEGLTEEIPARLF